MKHVQKFVLVPIEKWEKVKEKDMNLKEVTVQVPTQKVMNQEIQKKEDFTVESPVDSPVILKKIQDNLSKKKQIGLGRKKSQIFLYHPVKKRSKGTSLLRNLENNKNISWNKRGEIIYKGKKIPKSDILTLINHAIHNSKSEPVGMKFFYKVLGNSKVPHLLISNEKGKEIIKKMKEKKELMWRPPGCMNIKRKK